MPLHNIIIFSLRSFVPPVRDEEHEIQRKAHAKRVRETRRSTQGDKSRWKAKDSMLARCHTGGSQVCRAAGEEEAAAGERDKDDGTSAACFCLPSTCCNPSTRLNASFHHPWALHRHHHSHHLCHPGIVKLYLLHIPNGFLCCKLLTFLLLQNLQVGPATSGGRVEEQVWGFFSVLFFFEMTVVGIHIFVVANMDLEARVKRGHHYWSICRNEVTSADQVGD